jgi:TATA-box binding protein (TBP) (component of TFIID and TFIIIB)
LTGCKSVEEGVVVTKIIYEKLVSLNNKTDTILLTKDLNGVLLDKDNLVYSYNTKQIIGHKLNNSDLYVINKKEYMIDNKTQMFISNKLETQRRRFIYNFDGNLIGSSKIELLKNKNKFYKKNVNIFFDTTNDLIYHNNETIIGKIVYTIDDTNLINDIKKIPDIMEIKYKCNPFHNNDYNLDLNRLDFKEFIDLNVNCINVYFNINFIINRQRFYEKLIDLNYICKYKPESYSGIKLIYKINLTNDIENQGSSITNNLQEKTGHCHCSSKCTCINITFLIFQSGNVIVTGFKMTEQIKPVIDNFINLCNTMRFNIEKRSFIKLQ